MAQTKRNRSFIIAHTLKKRIFGTSNIAPTLYFPRLLAQMVDLSKKRTNVWQCWFDWPRQAVYGLNRIAQIDHRAGANNRCGTGSIVPK